MFYLVYFLLASKVLRQKISLIFKINQRNVVLPFIYFNVLKCLFTIFHVYLHCKFCAILFIMFLFLYTKIKYIYIFNWSRASFAMPLHLRRLGPIHLHFLSRIVTSTLSKRFLVLVSLLILSVGRMSSLRLSH